jgi:poly-gamma-glutamate synthesis protein (capsule biosynthesis protein)
MKKRLLLASLCFTIALVFFILYGLYKASPSQKALLTPKLKPISPSVTQMQIEPLTLEKIFFGNKKYLSKLPQKELITIISTGDIIPGRMVNVKSTQYQDFTWAFKNVWETLEKADLTVANLEAPLMKNCAATSEGMSFCGSDKHIEGIKQAGIDLVTLANNHSDNYGQDGITETTNLLRNNSISFTGLGETTFLTIKNIRFAFLGYNFLLEQNLEKITQEISFAKNQSDIVIVFPHWGEEYEEIPSAFETDTKKKLLNAGADVILGNHPHIIQPLTIDGNSLTFFAHGNFIFDQMWSEETKKGFILKTYIYRGKIIDAEATPVYIKDFGQPEIVTGEEREKMIRDLYKLSLKYKSF